MSIMFSIVQMNQLGDALELAGFTPDEVTKLRNFPRLQDFKRVISGQAKITIVKHIIDLDADPYIPDGWKLESHKKQGQLELDQTKIQLYLSTEQQGDNWIDGEKLRKELKTQLVYNANLLDYYLVHPELIPEEWKGRAIFFWATVYRLSVGNLYLRYLCFDGESWRWRYRWLRSAFNSGGPAAVTGK